MNASTLLDFFNHLGKSPTDTGASSNGAGGGSSGGRFSSLNGTLDRASVKEEPLSEEDLRALQKDRQKKDNHNMSMQYNTYLTPIPTTFTQHTTTYSFIVNRFYGIFFMYSQSQQFQSLDCLEKNSQE